MTYDEKKSLYEKIMLDVAKIAKRKLNESTVAYILQDRATARGEEELYLSIDEWLNDYNLFDDNCRECIIDVIEAIADGDDPKKYSDLAQKYWE